MSVAHDWRLGPYTVDDFDDPVRFPPDEGTYEMRDGWVLMSTWHGLSHEIIIDNAKAALRSTAARAGVKARVITPRVGTPMGLGTAASRTSPSSTPQLSRLTCERGAST